MLSGNTILLGVTGSIAAYKIANLASMLVKLHADVHVIMTHNACHFITPMTFETLTGHKCIVDTFDRNFDFSVKHVSLAKLADVVLVAPASANVIGKLAAGICDDMLTTTLLATKAPVIISPAMNTGMWENPILQDNIAKLAHYGYTIVQPVAGRLACGDIGSGKMPSEDVLLQHIMLAVACEKDMCGRRVLVTAGPTREAIDPVRFITNHSSGKMGYAIARMAALRGAAVTLVSGPVSLTPPIGLDFVPVVSAADMAQAVFERFDRADIVIMSAAVADYTPKSRCAHKMHKTGKEAQIDLVPTVDILAELGNRRRKDQFLCGFCMETENLVERAKEKRSKKKVDLIVANDLSRAGAGFGCNTNIVTLITEGDVLSLDMASKDDVARRIVDTIAQMMG